MKREFDDLHFDKAALPMPEECHRALMEAARSVKEEEPVTRASLRVALIAAVILMLLMAAAYAAFSSQVSAFFGRMYGNDMQEWLEQGDVATTAQACTVGDVTYTLDEVVYRSNGLYGVGTVKPREGSDATLIAEDCLPDEPYGYDVHGAGGEPEEAPDNTPTIADVARERGGKLLMVRAGMPDQIGVDGGEMLAPSEIGTEIVPQRDGSFRYMFEVSGGVAIGEGTTYTIAMYGSSFEMTLEGEILEETRQPITWTVEIKPEPMSAPSAAPSATPSAAPSADTPEIIAPDAYWQNGTMPVYRATARDFGADIRPELFNQSGIAEDHGDWLVFNDQAQLSWAPEAIFYDENDGTYNANFKEPDREPDYVPKSTLANEAGSLASWAVNGWPVTGEVYQLEKTELTHITLDEAKAKLEALLGELGLTDYVCDNALDMSVDRIRTLGGEMNRMRQTGEMGGNSPQYDYDAATAADEGYYLCYHKPGTGGDHGDGDRFSVYAYVTEKGVVMASIRDLYIAGEVYATPDRLIDPQTAIDALPGAIAASRFPEGKVVSIQRVRLLYEPMRAERKEDGMVLSPVWLILYTDEQGAEQGYTCWAEFDAITGKLVSAIFN